MSDVARYPDGRWITPPKSPGRPKGLSQSEKVRALLEPHREELIGRVLELTKSADPHAAAGALRIALERLAPAPKQEAERLDIPGLADATTFQGKCDAVIAAVANGEASADAGAKVLALLDVYRRALETDALVERIASGEARIAALEGGNTTIILQPAATPRTAEDFS